LAFQAELTLCGSLHRVIFRACPSASSIASQSQQQNEECGLSLKVFPIWNWHLTKTHAALHCDGTRGGGQTWCSVRTGELESYQRAARWEWKGNEVSGWQNNSVVLGESQKDQRISFICILSLFLFLAVSFLCCMLLSPLL